VNFLSVPQFLQLSNVKIMPVPQGCLALINTKCLELCLKYSKGHLKVYDCRVPVAQACKPSYSGGRDQEDCGSKPYWANSLQDPISKKLLHKKGLVEWLKVKALSSNPSTAKKKGVL
jgi:hypothetical protein